MTRVVAISPVSDAASPTHPDHARWVKEKTLQTEIEHAKVIGGSLRTAEDENRRLLERMEALARLPIKPAAPKKPRQSHAERAAARGVTIRKAKPEKAKKRACGYCGTCLACRRDHRVAAIFTKAREGDSYMNQLAASLIGMSLDASRGIGRFAIMSKDQAVRAVATRIDEVCDKSIRLLGAWR